MAASLARKKEKAEVKDGEVVAEADDEEIGKQIMEDRQELLSLTTTQPAVGFLLTAEEPGQESETVTWGQQKEAMKNVKGTPTNPEEVNVGEVMHAIGATGRRRNCCARLFLSSWVKWCWCGCFCVQSDKAAAREDFRRLLLQEATAEPESVDIRQLTTANDMTKRLRNNAGGSEEESWEEETDAELLKRKGKIIMPGVCDPLAVFVSMPQSKIEAMRAHAHSKLGSRFMLQDISKPAAAAQKGKPKGGRRSLTLNTVESPTKKEQEAKASPSKNPLLADSSDEEVVLGGNAVVTVKDKGALHELPGKEVTHASCPPTCQFVLLVSLGFSQ